MEINLDDKKYQYLIGHQKEDKYRLAFDALSKKVFNLSFEVWYQSGFWKDKYTPYTLFDGERAVANASINYMDFNVFGKQQRYIQIGTVMTDPDFRNRGLSKFLMMEIMKDWDKKCDFIYLYANPTATDFYPKFGFDTYKEYEYFKPINKTSSSTSFEKLNMDMQSNRDLLYQYAKNSNLFGKLSLHENADLVMFYCITFLKDNVFFIKSLDAIVIATFDNNIFYLWDIFSKQDVDLDEIISILSNSATQEVILGFTPLDLSSFSVREITGKDTLFIQKGKTNIFNENKIMFPLLSHA